MKKIFLFFVLYATFVKGQQWQWIKSLGYGDPGFIQSILLQDSKQRATILYCHINPTRTEIIECNKQGDTINKKNIENLYARQAFFNEKDELVISGFFIDTLALGSTSYYAKGQSDAIYFVTDSSFNLIKSKVISTNGIECFDAALLYNKTTYLVGNFNSGFSVDNHNFSTNNYSDLFLLKLDSNLFVSSSFQTSAVYSHGGSAQGRVLRMDSLHDIYLLGIGDSHVKFMSDTLFFNSSCFLAKFSQNLNYIFSKPISMGPAGDRYNPYMEISKSQQPLLLFTPGGGGGNIHQVELHWFSPLGQLSGSKKLLMCYDGILHKDEQQNLYAGGVYGNFSGERYLSIIRINPDFSLTYIIKDSITKKRLQNFSVIKKDEFYMLGNCEETTMLGGCNCNPMGSRFLAYYGKDYTGLKESTIDKFFSVYPNPTNDKLFIELKENGEELHYSLTDVTGKEVIRKKRITANETIDVSRFAKGVYFLQIETNSQTAMRKIVID